MDTLPLLHGADFGGVPRLGSQPSYYEVNEVWVPMR